ncbi:hypothetical protein [Nocardia neocaledoniensis]|uniref:Uncharacterized protein n=1 Tax=Nocardia neocaledoniensis TaxID=236511 RepID=A0A317N3F3_9NOCA|nr:hypothetical protein [Nocardia neocaledoniensis]PWV68926.1 hypothetical protein DFR69_11650 [Nocardia neocaledoniensis]
MPEHVSLVRDSGSRCLRFGSGSLGGRTRIKTDATIVAMASSTMTARCIERGVSTLRA